MVEPSSKVFRNVYNGTAKRVQLHSLPKEVGWKWESPSVVLARDGACAASNAASTAWENSDIIDNVCAWHASNRWFQKNTALFKNAENIIKIKDDFNLLKNCPKMNHVSIWKEIMLNHWRFVYKECAVADAWDKSWGKDRLTKVEANESNPLRGGIPCDNNLVESQNRVDKAFLDWKKKAAAVFFHDLSECLREQSLSDLSFTGKLKEDVHCMKFYRLVEDIFKRHRTDKPTFLSMTKNIAMPRNDIPNGSFVCAGDTLLSCLEDSEIPNNKQMAGKMFNKKSGSTTAAFKAFKAMLENPIEFSKGRSFHDLTFQSKCFHIMCPLETANSFDKAAVLGLHQMLVASNIPVISFEDLCLRDTKNGLVSCDCSTYLSRGWCKHSFAFALERKIITGYPQSMNPTSTLLGKKKPCRIANATICGALMFE
jgi:hypothetical protein